MAGFGALHAADALGFFDWLRAGSAGGFQKDGAQAWKAPFLNYEPRNHLTTTDLFQDFLSFQCSKGEELIRLAEFEDHVGRCEKASGEIVSYACVQVPSWSS